MLKCEDCGHPYTEFGLDTTVSNYQWSLIHPESSNGILCAKCMVQRASKLSGVIAARMVFEFAPHEAVEQLRAPDAGDSASFLNLFYPIFNILNKNRRNPPQRG